jgi:hypothetical protein
MDPVNTLQKNDIFYKVLVANIIGGFDNIHEPIFHCLSTLSSYPGAFHFFPFPKVRSPSHKFA